MTLENSRANEIAKQLTRLKGKNQNLVILETGTIRNTEPQYVTGDGHSTHIICNWVKKNGGNFRSADLDISVAKTYLTKLGLIEYVTLVQSDSVKFLKDFSGKADLVYLDTANDASLILREFQAIEGKMQPWGVVIIDDCVPGSTELMKGNKVIPYAKKKGYRVELKPRQGMIWFS